jgi:methionyl-tRNA synthetase
VVQIETVADHPSAESLYVLQVDLGGEKRTVCAGLRKFLRPDDLTGRFGILVANLKPAQIRGVESRGMLLAADNGQGGLQVVEPKGARSGDSVSVDGIPAQPKEQITLKEFEKAPLRVKAGQVCYQDKPLTVSGQALQVQAPEGSEIR